MASAWKPAKACHDFNNDFTLFTAVPVLFNMYTDKDSNLISAADMFIIWPICQNNLVNSVQYCWSYICFVKVKGKLTVSFNDI